MRFMKDISDEIDNQESKETEKPAPKRHSMFKDAAIPERKPPSNPHHPGHSQSGDVQDTTYQQKQFSSDTHQQTF